VLPVGLRALGPQALGAPAAAIAHVKRNHLAALRIHGKPNPLLVGFLLHNAGHFIRFHLQALAHDVVFAEDRLDVEMIRQCRAQQGGLPASVR
jgi:hypothetical protein